MPKILIATNNRWKVQLFKSIFASDGLEAISLRDIETTLPAPDECGRSVVENALIKARHYHSTEFPWVFGDDTGLEIDALNGEPGVQFRRWGGRFADDVSDETWLAYLLARMKDVPPAARTACFVDGWALISPNHQEYTHEIRAPFQIATQPVRPPVPGSPVMACALGIPDDPAQIFAQARAHWAAWGVSEKIRSSSF